MKSCSYCGGKLVEEMVKGRDAWCRDPDGSPDYGAEGVFLCAAILCSRV